MSAEGATAHTGRWLPEDARLIALVRDPGGDAWAAGVAAGLADMVGRYRGRTYLANVAGAVELDRQQGVEGGAGLTSALTGAATIASIARASPGGRFVYLPAGEAALPFPGLRRMQKFRRFLDQVKRGGGTLLLYVGEEDLLSPGGAGRVHPIPLDGCIALGEAHGLAAALGAPLLARVERPAPPPGSISAVRAPAGAGSAGAGAGTGAREAAASLPTAGRGEGSAPQAGSSALGSATRLLLPIAALVLVWVGWAVLGGPSPAAEQPGEGATAAADTVASRAGGGAREVVPGDTGHGGTRSARAAEPARAPAERSFDAPTARYSVLVASYIRLSDAMTHRVELAEDGGLFYVSPTPVRGRVYYRVLAGVHEDQADAAALMAALVADGRKEIEKAWDIRPVRLAYDLGTFATREAAEARAEGLRRADVPVYVLRDTAEAPLYRVYAGGFSSEDDAAPLGRRLEAAGEGAKLITRAGVAP